MSDPNAVRSELKIPKQTTKKRQQIKKIPDQLNELVVEPQN